MPQPEPTLIGLAGHIDTIVPPMATWHDACAIFRMEIVEAPNKTRLQWFHLSPQILGCHDTIEVNELLSTARSSEICAVTVYEEAFVK